MEIRDYRAKRFYDKVWLHGNLVVDKHGTPHVIDPMFFYEDGHHLSYDDDTDLPVFIEEDTLGQYIGKPDVNGTKVYEGDIFKIRFGFAGGREPKYTPADYPKGNVVDIHAWVAFENGSYCLKTKFPTSIPSISHFISGVKERDWESCIRTTPVVISEKTFGCYSWKYYEILGGVVGNIYDNPELLEEHQVYKS